MTYLQMVNNVLKRLREREVSSVNENSYSALIGVLLNDAKKEVENSWDWSALRTSFAATTSSNVYSYSLTGSGNTVKMLNVFNDTDDVEMKYADAKWMTQQMLLDNRQEGSPYYYSFNGIDANGDTVVDIYPIPDGTYNLYFNAVDRNAELEDNADETILPTQPILLLAYAKAIEERGEDGGIGASSAYATANRSLNDHISLDAIKHPEELIWQEV
jgi:hypothetical protein